MNLLTNDVVSDFLDENGRWKPDKLNDLPQGLRDQLSLVHLLSNKWSPSPNGYQWPFGANFTIIAIIRGFIKFEVGLYSALSRQLCFIAWQPPLESFVEMNVDAAVISNLRELSMGDLCQDNGGYWIFGFMGRLGMGTILKAELHVVYKGLTLVWDHGCQ
ncbi:Uncharacterized protein TCM_016059 [Theobroma cacao]|uniref:Uncharacterized protein n=1 Tax=Theobroma cacao TaxID=3641 RepID=A0A061G3M1_THECC|nr:Uncharacterized protein TCM_016059 [Theobroma cacao]